MDDTRDRIVNNKPDSFFHKIAGIVPGYDGYVDRERRRDADKILRTQLARRYSEQRDRLNRVQQSLARSHNMESIAEVDRLVGVLQRFIDRLSTATYGYSGLFDPVKVEAAELDQLYAFDMSLAGGVDQVSAAIDAAESAASQGGPDTPELRPALSRLGGVLDELNRRLNERADLLTSGNRLPDTEYRALVSNLQQPGYTSSLPPQAGTTMSAAGVGAAPGITSEQLAEGGGQQGGEGTGAASAGIPTTNLSTGAYSAPGPGMAQIVTGDSSFSEMTGEQEMGKEGQGPVAGAGAVGSMSGGIETASSPAHMQNPGAPGHDMAQGIDIANDLGQSVGMETLPDVTQPGEGQGHVHHNPGQSETPGQIS